MRAEGTTRRSWAGHRLAGDVARRDTRRRTATRAGSADLVVISNRLPVRLEEDHGRPGVAGEPRRAWCRRSPRAARPRRRVGRMVGSLGLRSRSPTRTKASRCDAVPISDEEYEDFYLGFANRTLWPLYHDAIRTPSFERRWWQSYVSVNHRYAEAAAAAAGPGATVWVHDYHLQLVPMMLRALRPDVKIGFFLHIPFPPQELFVQLPWRREILEGLLGADLVGFQVPGAASNFSRLARRLTDATQAEGGLQHDGRIVRVGAFPISIDAGAPRRARDGSGRDRARARDPPRPRRPGARAARRRPARLHQGHRPAPARGRRAVRRRRARDAAARDGADRGSEPRRRHALPARARATSSDSSARSTARGHASATPRSTTCTRACRSTSWSRSTSRPT